MKLNNKGFTLIELLTAIVVFAIVAGIGAYSISAIIKNSKQKNYELFVKNIKDAAEVYYQECKYNKPDNIYDRSTTKGLLFCSSSSDGNRYSLYLSYLVDYGYLTGNSKVADGDNKDNYTLVNPLTNDNLMDCYVYVTYDNGEYTILDRTNNGKCPTSTDYGN